MNSVVRHPTRSVVPAAVRAADPGSPDVAVPATDAAVETSQSWVGEDTALLATACDRVFGVTMVGMIVAAVWLALKGSVGVRTPVLIGFMLVENMLLSALTRRGDRPLRVELLRFVINVALTAYIYVACDGPLRHFWIPAAMSLLGAAMIWSMSARRAVAGFGATLAYSGGLLVAYALSGSPRGWATVLADALGLTLVGFIVSLSSALLGGTLQRARLGQQEAERARRELALSLERLTQTQRQLLDASRRAGMADVATSVLHNVGNVLNSVNVSAGVVGEIVRGSRAAGVARVAELLRQNQDTLGAFVTSDPRGQKIPGYLLALAGAIDAERVQACAELDSLSRNIDHIKAIVSLQQSHARPGGLVERTSLAELLDDALKFNFASNELHGIDLVRDYTALPDVEVDRHKVVQILINLLSNARHAIGSGGKPLRQVTVRTERLPDDVVSIEVSDNGCGILPEHLDKIFRHGFTTKADGHGFGLHSAACATTELGGSLTVRSEGAGKGAVFTLHLPVRFAGPGREAAVEAKAAA